MNIETSSAIKHFFPSPSLTLVYFEALANALDAGSTEIAIEIEIAAFDKPESLKITISDNGDGFTNENFERFTTLLKPRDMYHKGIGRLVFLHYFQEVEITSVLGVSERRFIFKSEFDGRDTHTSLAERKEKKTHLVFKKFVKERIKSYDHLKPESLKWLIIEQFLPTLHARRQDGKTFEISIELKTEGENSQKQFFPDQKTITENDLWTLTTVDIEEEFFLGEVSSIQMHYHIMRRTGFLGEFS